jgi:hypothetical protein
VFGGIFIPCISTHPHPRVWRLVDLYQKNAGLPMKGKRGKEEEEERSNRTAAPHLHIVTYLKRAPVTYSPIYTVPFTPASYLIRPLTYSIPYPRTLSPSQIPYLQSITITRRPYGYYTFIYIIHVPYPYNKLYIIIISPHLQHSLHIKTKPHDPSQPSPPSYPYTYTHIHTYQQLQQWFS